jgi:hypothetical protein
MRRLAANGRIGQWFYWIYLERSGMYSVDVVSTERAIYLSAYTIDDARMKVREAIA